MVEVCGVCGSAPLLSPICRVELTLDGNGASPYCDHSGCINQLNSAYQGTFPTGIAAPYTLALWAVLYGDSQTFISIRVIKTNFQSTGSLVTLLELRKQSDKLHLTNIAGTYSVVFNSSDWGDRQWTFIYMTSFTSDTRFASIQGYTFRELGIGGITDLSSSIQIRIGNNFIGNEPVKLIRYFAIYSSALYWTSSPKIADVFIGLYCLDFQTFFCPDVYIHLIADLAYTNKQTILDVSSNAVHAINGIDETTTQDALIAMYGVYFDGTSRITMNSIPANLISPYSFSISMWIVADPGTYSSTQVLFRSSDDNFIIQITPNLQQIKVYYYGSVCSGNTFSHLTTWAWGLLSVSILLNDSTSLLCVIGYDTHLVYGILTGPPVILTGFTLGQSFFGYFKDFMIFKTFMSQRTFNFPSNLRFLCTTGNYYDVASKSCQACHSACLNCRDSTNTFCGVCASGFELEFPGVPGTCYPNTCDDSCLTCTGPQYYECVTCRYPYFPGFSSGSGECVYACSQLSSELTRVNSQCEQSNIRVSLQELSYNFETTILLLHFTQPLYFINLQISDFQISSGDFEISLTQEYQTATDTLEVELIPISSFDFTQGLNITISRQNIATTTSHHTLQQSYQFDTVEFPPQYVPSKRFVFAFNWAGLIPEGGSLLILLSLAITQSYFQISFEMLWALINFNQLVYFAPFMNLSLPSLLFLLLLPLRFSVGDLLLLVMLSDFLFSDYLDSLPSESFSNNFVLHGFPTMSILTNCGPIFLFFSILLFFLFLYFLLFCKFFKKCFCMLKVKQCCSGMKWNSFLRTFLEGMIDLLLFSFLNIFFVLGNQDTIPSLTPTSIVSFSLSCLIALILFLFFFGIFRILAREPIQLGTFSSQTYRTYGELYKNQNYVKSFCAKHYQIWFILRRLLIIGSIAFISRGLLQLALAQAVCITELVVLLRVKPFKSKADNTVSMICEFCLLGYYGCLGIMQFVEWRFKIALVWTSAGLVLLGNTIGFFILVNQKRMDCKKERRRKKELVALKERVSKRFDTSILTMIHPMNRRSSVKQNNTLTSISSRKPTELSLFRPRSNYTEQSRKFQEVEIKWKANETPERETKVLQL